MSLAQPQGTQGEAEALKVLLYSCQSAPTQVKEKAVKGKSRQLSALLGFWWRWCFSTQPHVSKPVGVARERGEVEGPPKPWLLSQEECAWHSLSSAMCPSDTAISSFRGKQSPFPASTRLCYTSNGMGTIPHSPCQLSQIMDEVWSLQTMLWRLMTTAFHLYFSHLPVFLTVSV